MIETPEDIIFQKILPNLPAKSLVRLKCVTHQWNDFISTTPFAKTHLLQQLSLSSSDSNLDFSNFGSNFRETFNWFLGSCNGLVLLLSADEESCEYDYLNIPDSLLYFDFHFVVYNPVLGKNAYIEIEHPDKFLVTNDAYSAEEFNFGFGYVSSRDDYYIVAINFPVCLSSPEAVVFVYSLRLREWKSYKTVRNDKKDRLSLELQDQFYNQPGKLVKETLHWGVILGNDEKCIVTFDLANQEEFLGKMKLPYGNFGEAKNSDRAFCLCCLDDCLCAWANYEGGNVVEMWMLKEYGGKKSWSKLFRFNLLHYCRSFYGFTRSGMVFKFYNNNEIMLADFSHDPPEYFHIGCVERWSAVNYVPSLISPLAIITEQG
ncbi:F-box/kelch-repeat protein At3g23880-like [Chenopodium quinoa]|uniref:F-box/kelch-repeat protein At3g23880-like n=1 Tax=Chenopodium quinoa TaxID=63459 RepID=UPI000B76F4D0|nr:F-box/kelch-repeat protein At3g23880-like [Chenopodium quinoa]